MRTDATFDKRQVRCPNASMLGYGKWKAQIGDLVLYQEGERTRLARMIGRITYAPRLDNDKPIKNWILGIAMTGDMLEHTHERWIDPVTVVRVEPIMRQLDVLTWFLSADLVKADIDELRRYSSEGWSTLAAYRAWFNESRQIGKQATN